MELLFKIGKKSRKIKMEEIMHQKLQSRTSVCLEWFGLFRFVAHAPHAQEIAAALFERAREIYHLIA